MFISFRHLLDVGASNGSPAFHVKIMQSVTHINTLDGKCPTSHARSFLPISAFFDEGVIRQNTADKIQQLNLKQTFIDQFIDVRLFDYLSYIQKKIVRKRNVSELKEDIIELVGRTICFAICYQINAVHSSAPIPHTCIATNVLQNMSH